MSQWHDISIASDGTHHARNGTPLYVERFDEVLKYHAPGLAPVLRLSQWDSEAWHIDTAGRPAYGQRFLRTFGFYEGRAVVVDGRGWGHILPDGSQLCAERYDWCGNFQGGRCTVRAVGGSYHHVDPEGRAVYAARWRYAGDFRDGVAVVQGDNGQSSHIDLTGDFVHEHWFLDLDVFHKSYARARDADGWLHVDRVGKPIYARRFAAVEPFYNGQARVERFDGGLEIVDERGRTAVELRPALRSEFASLSDDLVGFWRTAAIAAAVELGVFEALPARVESIARSCAMPLYSAGRLLRALCELRLVVKEGSRWAATRRGRHLRRDDPLTLADAAGEYASHFVDKWRELPDALQAVPRWDAENVFYEVAADPERTVGHHRMLRSYARHDYPAVAAILPLRGDEELIDAGGGVGVLAGLLAERHPAVRVTVLDREEVVAQLAVSPGLGGRVTGLAKSLFKPWGITADAIVMSRILHDWRDELALMALEHAREALSLGGRLFIVEMVLKENEASGGLCDLHLMMASGGRERSASGYAALLDQAGFSVVDTLRPPALPSVIVAEAR